MVVIVTESLMCYGVSEEEMDVIR